MNDPSCCINDLHGQICACEILSGLWWTQHRRNTCGGRDEHDFLHRRFGTAERLPNVDGRFLCKLDQRLRIKERHFEVEDEIVNTLTSNEEGLHVSACVDCRKSCLGCGHCCIGATRRDTRTSDRHSSWVLVPRRMARRLILLGVEGRGGGFRPRFADAKKTHVRRQGKLWVGLRFSSLPVSFATRWSRSSCASSLSTRCLQRPWQLSTLALPMRPSCQTSRPSSFGLFVGGGVNGRRDEFLFRTLLPESAEKSEPACCPHHCPKWITDASKSVQTTSHSVRRTNCIGYEWSLPSELMGSSIDGAQFRKQDIVWCSDASNVTGRARTCTIGEIVAQNRRSMGPRDPRLVYRLIKIKTSSYSLPLPKVDHRRIEVGTDDFPFCTAHKLQWIWVVTPVRADGIDHRWCAVAKKEVMYDAVCQQRYWEGADVHDWWDCRAKQTIDGSQRSKTRVQTAESQNLLSYIRLQIFTRRARIRKRSTLLDSLWTRSCTLSLLKCRADLTTDKSTSFRSEVRKLPICELSDRSCLEQQI